MASNLLWVVQGNLHTDEGLQSLINILKFGGYDYRLVRPIPFLNQFVDVDVDINQHTEETLPVLEIPNDRLMVTMGSYSLAKTAKERGWTPGAFINDNFEFRAWVHGWGAENMLNGDAIEGPIRQVSQRLKDMLPIVSDIKIFARPSEDTKSFSGQVFTLKNLHQWFNQIIEADTRFGLNADTSVVVASHKKILAEYRLFVVDGMIATASLYKSGDRVVYTPCYDRVVFDFAYRMMDKWEPDRAYVLDIAETENGYKVIEVNNINSSGFYAANIAWIVEAIDQTEF